MGRCYALDWCLVGRCQGVGWCQRVGRCQVGRYYVLDWCQVGVGRCQGVGHKLVGCGKRMHVMGVAEGSGQGRLDGPQGLRSLAVVAMVVLMELWSL